MGLGNIATSFVRSLARHTNQRVVAVGSRSARKSAEFAARHSVAAAHPSYEDLVADPSVDIVYIGTPTSSHHDGAMLALRAGKHERVEKSFAANSTQAREMVEEAARRGLFVMEAMWPRFLPYMDSVRQILENGGIGDPLSLQRWAAAPHSTGAATSRRSARS